MHRVIQLGVLALHAARGHPVGRQLDLAQVLDRRGGQVGQRLADRHAAGGRRIDHGQRGALTHGHRFAGLALVVERGHGHVGNRHLPRADHLVARVHAAHGTVANGDQEGLVGHGRMAQHVAHRLLQTDAGHVHRRQFLLDALDVAMHARRLAQQHVHRHVDGVVLLERGVDAGVDQLQLLFLGGDANHGERRTLALAHGLELREAVRRDCQHIALLRLVAPDLRRRQAGLFQVHLAQVEARATVGAVHQFREGVGDAARADVVDRQDRVGVAELPAGVDHFLRAALHLGVAALDRIEV
ncbi:hypothetical protein D3C72_1275220 [compost metagenome]